MRPQQWLYEIFSYLLASLFLYTALSKALDFQEFTKEINNQNFSKAYTPFLVYSLPTIELIVTLLLLWPKMRLWGLYLSSFLMIAFTLYVALVTFHFYDRLPCACAGVFKHMTWPQHLLFNISFTLIAIGGLLLGTRDQSNAKKQRLLL